MFDATAENDDGTLWLGADAGPDVTDLDWGNDESLAPVHPRDAESDFLVLAERAFNRTLDQARLAYGQEDDGT
jgi:hypothetical protein